MRIAMIFGTMSSGMNGPFDPRKLYTTESRPITGSESSFFNIAWGLSEMGHEVTVYCDATATGACSKLHEVRFEHIKNGVGDDYAVYISMNEPDQLRQVPRDRLRICWIQWNDLNFAQAGYDDFVDIYVALSPVHMVHLQRSSKTPPRKWAWLPNSINAEFLEGDKPERRLHSMAWCSSPDRGLHRLLEMFPDIRRKVPDATLDIYYGIDKWYNMVKDQQTVHGKRARYVEDCLARLGRDGENGVTVVGGINNLDLYKRLQATRVLPYTCDTVTFTEGFSVAIMDALAAGCVPIISDIDAIGDIYKEIAHIIPGRPVTRRSEWIDSIVRALQDPLTHGWSAELTFRGEEFARRFTRPRVAGYWDTLVRNNVGNLSTTVKLTGLPTYVDDIMTGATGSKVLPALQQLQTERVYVYTPRMRIALLLGKLSASDHGQFNIDEIYERGSALTGTGLNYFNLAWGLAERGHTVDAFCDTERNYTHVQKLSGVNVYPIKPEAIGNDYDAYISINEPDVLRAAPPDRLRVCIMYLNDFTYTTLGFDHYVDAYSCPSIALVQRLISLNELGLPMARVTPEKMVVMPLSTNIEFYDRPAVRRPHSVVYCSSPDRGLHVLLEIFPEVRKHVPDATLDIYYRLDPWLQAMLKVDPSIPHRRVADRVKAGLELNGRDGEKGVTVHGSVPNRTMAQKLLETQVLAYTCQTIMFTEGFSVAVLDACAAGCVPIISGVDALPEVYNGIAHIVPGRPEDHKDEWVEAIVNGLTNADFANRIRTRATAFASNYTRPKIAALYEQFLWRCRKQTGPR